MNELRNPTQNRVNTVLFAAILTAWSVFMVVVIAAFSTYGSDCESNVLKSYPGMCMYICVCMCIGRVYVYICVLGCVYMYICVLVCVYVYTYIIYVYNICMCVYM